MPITSFSPIVVVTPGGTITTPGTTTAPAIPRNFTPSPEDRYVSFVIELMNDATDADVTRAENKINQVLSTKLSGYFPELFFFESNIRTKHLEWIKSKKIPKNIYIKKELYKDIFSKFKTKKFPRLQFTLTRLFPGSETDFKSSKKFGLHKFLLLTIPIFERQFEARTTANKLYAKLFDASYELKKIANIQSVNPSTQFKRYDLLSTSSDDVNTLPKNWMHTSMNSVTLPAGINGNGVVVGHPDSGWTPHPNLNFTNVSSNPSSINYDLTKDWNVFNDANTAEESLDSIAITHFHGTSTGSMIVGNGRRNNVNELAGIAPGAKIISVRTIAELDTGVVLIGDTDVARAVWYEIQQNVDVISLSVGGYPAPALECVIAHAVYNNIIVCAAAGQFWPFIVFPAAYPECIAVGASNNASTPWSSCVKDSKIAISAPGEKIWSAYWDDASPNRHSIIEGKGNGCSFATALVAGTAALWLQRYGKQTLMNELQGRATLQELYIKHVQNTATVPTGWNTSESGAGIINVARLLDTTTLPNRNTFVGQSWNNWRRRTAEEILYIIYENTDPVVIRERLQNMNARNNFEQIGQEFINLILGIEQGFEDFKVAAESAVNDAEDAVKEFIDDVEDAASDVVNTILGWLP
ncbi:MAG: S8/S53 family peptidase [Candidatus Brocadiaceae bacterium]|uniref:S8 family peptidase n=1 Tax=Candidatus Wunengus sp. YC61 TaxID=3367698 RepID=UPI0027207987|nr:S8/S53 family peptidase [Candidatus Brocadiaceae bacterium]